MNHTPQAGRPGRACLFTHLIVTGMLLHASSLFADVRTIRVPIEISGGEGCVHDAQHAALLSRVAVPNENGVIAIEAERPSRHFCDPKIRRVGAPLPKDAEASGEGMLDHAIYARYDLQASKEGTYDLWIRLATAKGRNRHIELLNGRRFTGVFIEDNDDKGKPYHWGKRARIKLNAGLNTFELARYHGPFPKVDKIVFAPVGAEEPKGMGPQANSAGMEKGWIETTPMRVPGIRRVVRVEGAAGAVKISTDDGQNWTGVGDEPIDVTKDAAVRLRVEIRRGHDENSPEIGPLALCAEVDPEICIELKNKTSRLLFDKRTGGLFLVECLATGDAVVSPDRARPLAAVELKKAGQAEWLRVGPEERVKIVSVPDKRRKGRRQQKEEAPQAHTIAPESVTVSGTRLEATYVFTADGIGKAKQSYIIEPASDGLWRFAVTTHCMEGPADVTGVVFPIFEHIRIGASGLDDHQLRLQSFGHHRVQPGKGPIRDSRYLGGTVLPWTEVYDDRTGFYVCPQDPGALNTLYTSKAGGQAAEFFATSATKLHPIRPGQTRTDEYVVAAHPGQWHWGADRYRAWFYETHGRAAYPEWLQTMDGWIDLQAENYGKKFRFSKLPDWLTRARAVGLDWVQVWGQFAYDGGPCCCAIYPPSPMYGGAAGWKAAAAQIKRRGGYVGGYFIYDRTDILPLVTDDFLAHFKRSEYPPDTVWPKPKWVQEIRLVSDASGAVPPWPPAEEEMAEYRKKSEEHRRLYAEGKRARAVQWWIPTYINDPRWPEHLRWWIVDKYAKEYGCNSCYIDVLGCGSARESFDPRRRHNGEGQWGMGKMLIAKTVTESARKHDPNFAMTQEGLGDLPALYCIPMCSGVYRGGRNVYRYTFPERILLHGMANSGSGGSGMDRFLETYLEGMRYDIVGRPTALPVNLLRLREQFSPLLYASRFRDTVGLKTGDPRIHARLHLLESGPIRGGLITLVNRERLDGAQLRVDTAEIGAAKTAFFVGLSGAAGRLSTKQDGNEIVIDVPPEPAATILLPARVEDGSGVWPVFYMKRVAPPAAQVTLLNLTDRAAQGTCRIENLGFTEPFEKKLDQARSQLAFTQPSQAVSLQPLEAKTLSFPLSSLRHHQWTTRVKVAAELKDRGQVARTFLATPLVPDASWEMLGEADPTAPDGEKTLTLPPTDSGYLYALPDLWLEPGRTYRLTVKAKRSGFKADVLGTLLMATDPDGKPVWDRKKPDTTRPNEWQTVTYEFKTPPDLLRAGIYLYNVRSSDTAWFDDLYVEEIPAGKDG